MMLKKILLLMILPMLSIAQNANNIDKIVAKIDNYYILKSDVENLTNRAKQQNQNLDKCKALETLSIQKLLVAKAEIDSVIVDDEQVKNQLDSRMAEMARVYGNEKNIVQQFGKSIETLKSEYRNEVKEQLTAQKMQSTITDKLTVTPNEVKRFFNAIPSDSLPIIPTEVILSQIVRLAEITKSQKKDIINKLEDFKRQIQGGTDFAVLAKEYSDDPGSKQFGGDLGWAKRGAMVPEFEAAAMSLDSGKISKVIETDFGYHIIQTLQIRGQEYHARHILLRPDYMKLDMTNATKFLDSIKIVLEKDSLKFEKAVKKFSQDKGTVDSGGIILDPESGSQKLPLDASMEPNMYFKVDPLKVGQISNPMNYRTPDGKTGMRIIKVKAKIDAHRANLKDDYEKLKVYTLNQKQNEVVEKWFKTAIAEVYINIDPEYKTCKIFEH